MTHHEPRNQICLYQTRFPPSPGGQTHLAFLVSNPQPVSLRAHAPVRCSGTGHIPGASPAGALGMEQDPAAYIGSAPLNHTAGHDAQFPHLPGYSCHYKQHIPKITLFFFNLLQHGFPGRLCPVPGLCFPARRHRELHGATARAIPSHKGPHNAQPAVLFAQPPLLLQPCCACHIGGM